MYLAQNSPTKFEPVKTKLTRELPANFADAVTFTLSANFYLGRFQSYMLGSASTNSGKLIDYSLALISVTASCIMHI